MRSSAYDLFRPPSDEGYTRNKKINDTVIRCTCGELAVFRMGAFGLSSGYGAYFVCAPCLDRYIDVITHSVNVYRLPNPGENSFGEFLIRHDPKEACP